MVTDWTAAQMAAVSYGSFNAFCIAILSIVLYTTLIDVDRNSQRRLLIVVLVAVICYCTVDIFWMLVYEGILPRNQKYRYLSNVILYGVMSWCSFAIFEYLDAVISGIQGNRHDLPFFSHVLMWLMVAMSISTPFTHILFSIDEEGNMHRSLLYMPFMTFMYLYVLVAFIRSLSLALKKGNEVVRGQFLAVAIHTVPIMAGTIIHLIHYTIPSFSIGFTIATLTLYLFQMRAQVSRDELTGLNNRKQGENFFQKHIADINGGSTDEKLFLFMLDLNRFKQINDRYGHSEGDRALIKTAEALKKVNGWLKNRCILCRFGGDEFVIGTILHEETEAQMVCSFVADCIDEKNKEEKVPYRISASIGYAQYSKEMKNLRGLLNAADAMMYKNKDKAHRNDKGVQG